MLCKIAHRNICRLFAFSTDGPNRCLVMELCTGGALDDRIIRKAPGGNVPPPLEWQHRVQILLDIGLALEVRNRW
jgi:serine/threonine protein kinase